MNFSPSRSRRTTRPRRRERAGGEGGGAELRVDGLELEAERRGDDDGP